MNLGLPLQPKRNVRQQDIDNLSTDGVVLLRDALPREWIAPLRGAVDDLLTNPAYLERGQTPEAVEVLGGTMVNGFMGWLHNEVFAALATHSPISEIARQFLPGQNVQFFYDQMFVKRPGQDVGTPWHRDRNYYAINGKDFLSIWVPFDPVRADETALTYIKGSHRHDDVLDADGHVIPGGHSPSGLFDQLGEHPQGVETISWDIEPGDIVLHDLLSLIHI